ncbi:MAG TPA: hypothetical protein PKN85_00380 [Syntrophorhabdaceae bacterium]|nr:hypothetical protein [Syntrophorhabdaceae bacterium]HOD74840.1 hypothetical protein [Syntrophorhabdaceae bacterium]
MKRERVLLLAALPVLMAAVLAMISVTADAQVFSKEVTVGELVANPSQYDQKNVTVNAYAFIVRQKKDRGGNPFILVSIFDPRDRKKVITAFGPGSTQARNGDMIKLTGKFKARSKRGRYTYDNEIETTGDKVVVTAKGTGP